MAIAEAGKKTTVIESSEDTIRNLASIIRSPTRGKSGLIYEAYVDLTVSNR